MDRNRKLIEVALPLEAINDASRRENYIYRGNPSAIHKWWAQRPLAACRAVIFASLVDDPSAHPELFPTEEEQEAERRRLFALVERLVPWEASTNETILQEARLEIRRWCGDSPPPVIDPFCGGGSIPLEAQRLGLETRASDLNPVAVLITKALIEIPSRFAGRRPVNPDARAGLNTWKDTQGLAEDVRFYGRWMRDEAERRIGQLYPSVTLPPDLGGGSAPVIAWLWARTVTCPNPACGASMPLVRSFALSTKKGKERYAHPIVDRENKAVRFEVRRGTAAAAGTVDRRGARCLVCETPVPLTYVRAEGKAGRIGSQLMAIVAKGQRERLYLSPDPKHEEMAALAEPSWRPDTELPEQALGFRVQAYGMTRHTDLFTSRQLVVLSTLAELIDDARRRVLEDLEPEEWPGDGMRLAEGGAGAEAYADAVATYLACCLSKLAEYNCALIPWYTREDRPQHLFARQAIPMVWDHAELNPFSEIGGSWIAANRIVSGALDGVTPRITGQVLQLDAASAQLSSGMVCTDPPYYDNIGYADLSDFFYVWLRHALRGVWPGLFSTLLTPKGQELVADPHRFDGNSDRAERFFEDGLSEAFQRMRTIHDAAYPMTVVYGFKQAEEDGDGGGLVSTGWETMLQGLLASGLSVIGTWPLRSERGGRMRDIGSNALASSIVLVCRPLAEGASLATRKEFLTTLKADLPRALRTLQQGNIAPVDLAQAAIGPGMAVFSHYARVVEADGSAMSVRAALGLINQVLDETLAEQESDFDAETRWAVAWFEQYGMNAGPFGVAETLSKAKNTAVNGLVEAGLLESRAGKVRLLDRSEMAKIWDPALDNRLTVWEVTQHLIRAHDEDGEAGAAVLLARVGGLGEAARELAYRLYTLCERKKWAKEALAYNSLVVVWPEVARLAGAASAQSPSQGAML